MCQLGHSCHFGLESMLEQIETGWSPIVGLYFETS